MPVKLFTEMLRKEVFLALVEVQDGGVTVRESRKQVAKKFGISEKDVQQLEREGLDKNWPPLGK